MEIYGKKMSVIAVKKSMFLYDIFFFLFPSFIQNDYKKGKKFAYSATTEVIYVFHIEVENI